MTLTELRYIVAVARDKHFGRAAYHCFVSQPTLSIAVKKLEDELGVVLFERGGSDILVTKQGKPIIEQAQRVLNEVEVLKQLASATQDELVGPLLLGIENSVGPQLLTHLLPALRDAAPNMPLQIEEGQALHLIEGLKGGKLEVIIIPGPCIEPATISYPLYDENFVIVVPKKHPWEKLEKIDLNQLANAGNENILIWDEPLYNRLFHSTVPSSAECSLRGASRLPHCSLTAVGHMVASGLGIAVMPITVVDYVDASRSFLTVLPIKTPAPKRQIILVTRKQFIRQKAVTVLRDAMAQGPLNTDKLV